MLRACFLFVAVSSSLLPSLATDAAADVLAAGAASPVNDAQQLLERGWTELRAGQLAQARRTTLSAVEYATNSSQLAAAAYNLGRIEEASGNPWQANADYQRSLVLRRNPSVAARQQTLAARLHQAPWPLLGPYTSFNALCGELATSEDRLRIDASDQSPAPYQCGRCEFVCLGRELKRISAGLPPPLDDVVIFESDSRDHHPPLDENFLNVAVRIRADWYLAPAIAPGNNRGAVTLLDASVQVPGGGRAPVLVVRYSASHAHLKRYEDDEEHVAIIGIGASGKPSLLSPVPVRRHEGFYPTGGRACDEETDSERQWRLGDGALVVTGETVAHRVCEKTVRKQRALSERYPLDFP